MYCPKCGAWNADGSPTCSQCQSQLSAQVQEYGQVGGIARPPNYLVWSILVTLCCCLPAGIVSIVYAAQVDSKFSGGDYAGAIDASNKARMWAWVSFGVGLVVLVVYGGIALMERIAGA